MGIKDLVSSPLVYWMEGNGPENDIVITSRIRLARNLEDLPFPQLLEQSGQGEKTVGEIKRAAESLPGFELAFCSDLSDLDRGILLEKHVISPELAASHSPYRGIMANDNASVSVLINEEDHLRIQCLLPGLQLNQAFRYADDTDNDLEKKLNYAFDERYGYLTSCPTNVGTGIRASVMLHLPAIAMAKQQGSIFGNISQLGLTVRGLYGEGTEAAGNFYQVSNQITLGQNEEDIINNLWTITLHILEQERNFREQMQREMRYQIEDQVWRAYGVATNARVITSNEALTLFSNVRMGVDMGILPAIPLPVLNQLIVAICPGHLQHAAGRQMEPWERDIIRARIIKEKLSPAKKEGSSC